MPLDTLQPPCLFFFNDTATTEIYTLSLHDALPICGECAQVIALGDFYPRDDHPHCAASWSRSEEHTSELQSHLNLVCRLLLEKKNRRGWKSGWRHSKARVATATETGRIRLSVHWSS